MLSQEIVEKINNGTITTRTQLWKFTKRCKRTREWLDANSLLLPTKRQTKEDVRGELRAFYRKNGKMPRYTDVGNTAANAQHHFGTWNDALYDVFGDYNQRRYRQYSDEDLLNILRKYVATYRRIPLRQEFDGKNYPYFETYQERFGCSAWAEVLKIAEIEDIPHYAQHGWGKLYHYEGETFLSHQEYLIGKYLIDNSVMFEKEVPYGGGSNFVFDFYLPAYDVYIEYFGISTPTYKENIKAKQEEYRGRTVIEIYKHDNTLKKLHSEVQRL